jgi:hypothetical protein
VAEYTGLDKRLQYLFQHFDSCKVVSGYYYNDQMYKDSAHTELITGSVDCLYIDKSTTTLYLYNGSAYEEVQGGGGGSTVTITPTLATGTKIADFSIDGVSDSLYAPTGGGGASDLDDLTDVTITSPTNGQALVYDSSSGEWVNGTISGGGASNGTVGVEIDVSIPTSSSVTYTFDELGIVRKGYYFIGCASSHAESNGGWKWIGYLSYSGTYTSSYPSSYVKVIDYYYTNVTMNESAKTLTFSNTSSGWGMTYRIQVLPLHPKLEIDTDVVSGYYYNGDFYEDQSYTQIITGSEDHLYIDLNTTTLYLFDGTDYVEVKGSGGGVGGNFISDLLVENTDFSVASGSSNTSHQYTLSKSIDLYDAVLVIGYLNVSTTPAKAQAASMIVFKNDYYINTSGVAGWSFLLNGSIPNQNRRLGFGFVDSTTIETRAARSENEEPKLYRVYGLKFGTSYALPMIYSQDEREIGCWVDGKPLYAKTVEYSDISFPNGTTGGARSFTKDFPADNVENVVFLNVNCTSASIYINVQYERVSEKQITINDITKASTYVRLHSLTIPADIVYGGVGTTYVTLYYTKSTDTAGSGHWTSAGVAHHYSTSEQVVGTWIDGKPIYEITYDFSASPILLTNYNTWYDTNVAIANFKKCVTATGMSDGSANIPLICGYRNDNIIVMTQRNVNGQQLCYLTIRYTKTTD